MGTGAEGAAGCVGPGAEEVPLATAELPAGVPLGNCLSGWSEEVVGGSEADDFSWFLLAGVFFLTSPAREFLPDDSNPTLRSQEAGAFLGLVVESWKKGQKG